MYSYIKGNLVRIATDHIVVDNNGIGYKILIPYNNDTLLPDEGQEILIHTHFNATENGVTLYGFLSEEDRSMFLKLTTVSGIGPKGALSILSTLSTRDIIFAILNDDDKAISRAPGIGPKTAKRMIVDLKDKMDITEDDLLIDTSFSDDINITETGAIQDAISALCALGYPYANASKAVKSIEGAKNLSVEELLSLSLKEL